MIPEPGVTAHSSAEIGVLHKQGSKLLMRSHKFPDIVLDFEFWMDHRPIMGSPDEREKGEQILKSLRTQRLPQCPTRARILSARQRLRAHMENMQSSASLSGSGESIAAVSADAAVAYRGGGWCLVYSLGHGAVSENCTFRSFEACRGERSFFGSTVISGFLRAYHVNRKYKVRFRT